MLNQLNILFVVIILTLTGCEKSSSISEYVSNSWGDRLHAANITDFKLDTTISGHLMISEDSHFQSDQSRVETEKYDEIEYFKISGLHGQLKNTDWIIQIPVSAKGLNKNIVISILDQSLDVYIEKRMQEKSDHEEFIRLSKTVSESWKIEE